MLDQRLIPVSESSQIGEARRAAARLAESTSLGETERGKLAIVVTELATNLVRHGGGGHVFVRAVGREAIEVVAVDRGRGMDFARCAVDGYSTGGTAGQGIGAVRRQSSGFDLFSTPAGSVLRCEVRSSAAAAATLGIAGLAQSAAPGEPVCGDGVAMADDGQRMSVMVVDGLGHGQAAADAARAATDAFGRNPFDDPERFLAHAHRALSGTRGAALAAVLIQPSASVLRYAGVGNIAGTLLKGDESKGLMSHNGIVGHQARKMQAVDHPWTPQSTLVMHSDGLQTRWTLGAYPGLLQRHPSLLAGVLHRDFIRGRDDATVVVLRSAGT